MQSPLCVDDYGNEVYRCHWTDELVTTDKSVLSGGFYPGVKSVWVSVPHYQKARQESAKAFHESEQNCNTCKHLERVPHKRNAAGFLDGKCRSKPIKHPYQVGQNQEIRFHPDDYMGMSCYETRT